MTGSTSYWTYETNNWGVGLPPQGTDRWGIFKPLLDDPALAPAKADMLNAAAHFLEILQIRKNSPLFRLQTAEQVQSVVSFYNTGPEQIPGLIVMRLTDKENIDPAFEEIVVIFNARPESTTFSHADFAGRNFALNSVQQVSSDAIIEDEQNATYLRTATRRCNRVPPGIP